MKLLLFIPWLVFSHLSEKGVGTTAHPILKTGFGVRAAGMGNAFVGLADDINGLFWNPAGLNQLDTWEVTVIHHEWVQGIRDEFVGIIWPNAPHTTIGLGLNLSTAGGIEHWDSDNFPVAKDSIISTYEGLALVTYTRKFRDMFNWSVSLKGLYENLYNTTGFGGALDAGMYFRPFPFLGTGIVVQNIGIMMYGDENWPLPMRARLGFNVKAAKLGNIVTDIELPYDNVVAIHSGLEIHILDRANIRMGYSTGPKSLDELGMLNGLSLGMGFLFKERYKLDYAYEPYGNLGPTQRIGISYVFGERPKTGGVIVKTIDKETKKPISADISLKGVYKGSHKTDERGKWKKDGLHPGTLEIKATKEDYYPDSGKVAIASGEIREKIIELSKIPPGSIKGRVYDVKTNKPLEAVITYKGPEEGEVKTEKGEYKTPSLYRGEYTLSVEPKHPKYFPQETKVKVEPDKTTIVDFGLLREKEVLVFHNIHFETGKARLLSDSYAILDKIGKILIDNPFIKVEVSGHTDPRPIHTKEFKNNMELSQARAEVVRNYLIEKFNISPERLTAKGYGETQPIAPNDTEEGMAMNRRTEFKVLTGLEYYHELRREETKPEQLKP